MLPTLFLCVIISLRKVGVDMTKKERIAAERYVAHTKHKDEIEQRKKLAEHIMQSAVKTLETEFGFGEQRLKRFLEGVNNNVSSI